MKAVNGMKSAKDLNPESSEGESSNSYATLTVKQVQSEVRYLYYWNDVRTAEDRRCDKSSTVH